MEEKFKNTTGIDNYQLSKFTKNSQKITYVIFLMSLNCCFAQMRAVDRIAEKNTIKVLYPDIAFDKNEAKLATDEGTSTIRGVLFTKEKITTGLGTFKPLLGAKMYGNNIQITLFPVTSYFEAWYDLRDKKENKRTRIYMSDDAFFYRIKVISDQYGRFQFTKMKPGKYFIQAFMGTNYQKNRVVYDGIGVNNYGGVTNYYSNETFFVEQNERIEKFVEIKTEGELVEFKLK